MIQPIPSSGEAPSTEGVSVDGQIVEQSGSYGPVRSRTSSPRASPTNASLLPSFGPLPPAPSQIVGAEPGGQQVMEVSPSSAISGSQVKELISQHESMIASGLR